MPSAGAVVSLQPLNGGATSGTFTSTFHHTGGANAHYLGYTLFLPTPNVVNYTAQGTCLVEYNRISKGVRLIDNAGTGWLGGAPISSTAQSLSNNQCTIQVSAMTATIDGNTMIVTIPVTFKLSIGPVLGTFLQALDVNGNWTGMTQFGNWGVPGAQQTRVGPAFAGIGIQAAATLNSRKLTTYIAHPAGAAGLSMITMLAASGISATKTCQVVFIPGLGINLIDDTRTAMVSPTWATPGQNVTLANSQCSFNANGVVWQPGPTSVLTMPMTFASPGLSGVQTIYVNAFDVTGRTTHWVTAGVGHRALSPLTIPNARSERNSRLSPRCSARTTANSIFCSPAA